MGKAYTAKVRLIITLALIVTFCWVAPPNVAMAAGAQNTSFNVMQQVDDQGYAVGLYCDKGMTNVGDNVSCFAISGNMMYYLTDWMPSAPFTATLWKSKLDGSGAKQIATYVAWQCNISNGVLVYTSAANEDGRGKGIYTYNLTTGKTTKLLSDADLIGVQGRYIYYWPDDTNAIFRCTMIGTMKRQFTNLEGYLYGTLYGQGYYVMPYDNYATYGSGDTESIYVLDTVAPARYDRVCDADPESGFIIHDDWLYYNYQQSLYKCRLDGSDAAKLCSVKEGSYGAYPVAVIGDMLYFVMDVTHGENNQALYKVNINGGKKKATGNRWFSS